MYSNRKPVVSIIMNCHNGEKYLYKSLNSILSQSFKNWELIFWDNSSIDNSEKIFLKFKDKRFRYFKSKKILKLYHARNLAINKARGKYICFLDTDDLWVKNKLKNQLNFFAQNQNFKIVYSNYYVFRKNINERKIKIRNSHLPSGLITQKLINNYNIGILTVMCEKKLFKDISFQKKYNIIGDFDFMLRASLKHKIGCIRKPLAFYRIHDSNFSKNIKMQIDELKNWVRTNKRVFNGLFISLFAIKKDIIKLTIKNYIKFFGRVVQW